MKSLQAAGVAVSMLVLSFVPARAQERTASPPKEAPGPARVLTAIEIIGAQRISSEEIIAFMAYTKVGRPLNTEKLKIDLDRTRLSLYGDRGFLRTQFRE